MRIMVCAFAVSGSSLAWNFIFPPLAIEIIMADPYNYALSDILVAVGDINFYMQGIFPIYNLALVAIFLIVGAVKKNWFTEY